MTLQTEKFLKELGLADEDIPSLRKSGGVQRLAGLVMELGKKPKDVIPGKIRTIENPPTGLSIKTPDGTVITAGRHGLSISKELTVNLVVVAEVIDRPGETWTIDAIVRDQDDRFQPNRGVEYVLDDLTGQVRKISVRIGDREVPRQFLRDNGLIERALANLGIPENLLTGDRPIGSVNSVMKDLIVKLGSNR